MTEELKKCPFCNGDAVVPHVFEMSNGNESYFVECMNCGVHTKRFSSEQEAVDFWNKRLLEKENERLKKKLDEALRQRDFNAGTCERIDEGVREMDSAGMKKQVILIGDGFRQASINIMTLQDNVSTFCISVAREIDQLRDALVKAQKYLSKVESYTEEIADEADYFCKVTIDRLLKRDEK